MCSTVLIVDIPALAIHVHMARTGQVGDLRAVAFVHTPIAHESWCVGCPLLESLLIEFSSRHVGVPDREAGNHSRHAVATDAQLAMTAEIFCNDVLAHIDGLFIIGRGIEHGDAVLGIVGILAVIVQRHVYPLVVGNPSIGIIDSIFVADACPQHTVVMG